MRANTVPKVYRSFEEFERDELHKLDIADTSIDEMLNDMFGSSSDSELDFEKPVTSRRRS